MLTSGWSTDPEGGTAECLADVVSPAGRGDFDVGRIEGDTGGLDPESVLFSFKGKGVSRSLSIATWNCACLFGGLPQNGEARGRVRGKMDRVVSMSNKYDVLFLQETHGTENDIATLQGVLPNHLISGSFCENPGAGGVVVVVSPNLIKDYGGTWSQRVVVSGRAIIVDLVDYIGRQDGRGYDPISFCCLHVVPAWSVSQKRAFFERLRGYLPEDCDEVVFYGG